MEGDFKTAANYLCKSPELMVVVDRMLENPGGSLRSVNREFIKKGRNKEFGVELHTATAKFFMKKIKNVDDFHSCFEKENSSISKRESQIIFSNLVEFSKLLFGDKHFNNRALIECEKGLVLAIEHKKAINGRCDISINNSTIIEIKSGEIDKIGIIQAALYQLSTCLGYDIPPEEGSTFILFNPISGKYYSYNFEEIRGILYYLIEEYLNRTD